MLSNSPWRPPLGLFTPSNRYVKISGTRRSPTPNDSAAARMNLSRRVYRTKERTRRPETMTLAKRKVVTPPKTGLGTGNGKFLKEEPREERRTCKEDSGNLSKCTEEDEESTAPSPCCTVCTASDRNNTIILVNHKIRLRTTGRPNNCQT
jgi:hypothetical protein